MPGFSFCICLFSTLFFSILLIVWLHAFSQQSDLIFAMHALHLLAFSFCICPFLNFSVSVLLLLLLRTCLQQTDFILVRHGEHWGAFAWFLLSVVVFFNFFCSILVLYFLFCFRSCYWFAIKYSFIVISSIVFESLYWYLDKRNCNLMLVECVLVSAFA